jgi:hypothetical protein
MKDKKLKSRMRTQWIEEERILLIQIKIELPRKPIKIEIYNKDNISSI